MSDLSDFGIESVNGFGDINALVACGAGGVKLVFHALGGLVACKTRGVHDVTAAGCATQHVLVTVDALGGIFCANM